MANVHITVHIQESVLEFASLCNEWWIETAQLIMQSSAFCNAHLIPWLDKCVDHYTLGQKELAFEILLMLVHT